MKIDSHVHINSDRGYFEGQALRDNFRLITLNTDHLIPLQSDNNYDYAITSTRKYPGKVFYAATFHFDTTGWETDEWNTKVISHLKSNLRVGQFRSKYGKISEWPRETEMAGLS